MPDFHCHCECVCDGEMRAMVLLVWSCGFGWLCVRYSLIEDTKKHQLWSIAHTCKQQHAFVLDITRINFLPPAV